MNDSERPERPPEEEQPQPERIIDVSGQDPVVVEDDAGYPFFTGGTERVRVFVASGGTRACAIPLALILLLLCCSCIVFWSLTDNLF